MKGYNNVGKVRSKVSKEKGLVLVLRKQLLIYCYFLWLQSKKFLRKHVPLHPRLGSIVIHVFEIQNIFCECFVFVLQIQIFCILRQINRHSVNPNYSDNRMVVRLTVQDFLCFLFQKLKKPKAKSNWNCFPF